MICNANPLRAKEPCVILFDQPPLRMALVSMFVLCSSSKVSPIRY